MTVVYRNIHIVLTSNGLKTKHIINHPAVHIIIMITKGQDLNPSWCARLALPASLASRGFRHWLRKCESCILWFVIWWEPSITEALLPETQLPVCSHRHDSQTGDLLDSQESKQIRLALLMMESQIEVSK